MTIEKFNDIVLKQITACSNTLISKGHEYAPKAVSETEETTYINGITANMYASSKEDRLLHFKKAAAIMNSTPKTALLGMLSKHIVSVSDMCVDTRDYPIEKWDEKITDSINYLLILRAIVEEEHHE